jgi:hypothetical protein
LFYFAIGKLRIAVVDRRGEDETSFGSGLILRDFCYFIAIVVSCCRVIWYSGVVYRILIVVSWWCIGRVSVVVPCYRIDFVLLDFSDFCAILLLLCCLIFAVLFLRWSMALMVLLRRLCFLTETPRQDVLSRDTEPSSNRPGGGFPNARS